MLVKYTEKVYNVSLSFDAVLITAAVSYGHPDYWNVESYEVLCNQDPKLEPDEHIFDLLIEEARSQAAMEAPW
jgi:hypothetical protein